MKLIFVADIFGVTEAFKELCQQVMLNIPRKFVAECHLIGPYDEQPKAFESEQEAYQYFMQNVTLVGYFKKLEAKLLTIPGDKVLIGFSVGGSAIWQLISTNTHMQSQAATCFYSSQIRQMTKLTPSIPTKLIFPTSEPHFSVPELHAALAIQPNVTIEASEYLHGFMNQQSTNFHPQAYQHYIKKLAANLSQQYLQQKITE